MVKKKRQSDPGEHGDESTESCDENVKAACPHALKAIDLTRLKKALKAKGFEKECSECNKSSKNDDPDSDFEIDTTLWMCLRCGNQLCGRARNKHALNHFNTPHSDCHALTANTTTWKLFCYNCNNELSPSSTKKLLECVEYLKRQANSPLVRVSDPNPPVPLHIETVIKTDAAPTKGKDKNSTVSMQRVRGLSNLGNTCFFNSVMQCLVQTPYLLPVLREMVEPGERFTLPGGNLKIEIKDEEPQEVDLPPITGELSEWGPLTRTLADTLADLQSPDGGDVYTPRRLLSALVSKLPQFGGGDQHDAHELLRHLLEAVRSEDLRRYQAVILNSLGISSKVDPSKVDGEVKQKVKFYGQQASDTMLRPEQVFRGFLVSTLECQECLHTSDRHEYFLDLSLPVAANRPQPPAVIRRKTPAQEENVYGSNTQEETKSKHQLKKERRKAGKKHAHRGSSSNKNGENSSNEPNGAMKEEGKSSSEQSDADVEDNLEDNPKRNDTHTVSIGTQAIADTAANFAAYHMESGYNSEKVISSDSIRASPTDLDKEKADNTPETMDKDKLEFPESVSVACSTTAIPLEYKPLASLENLSNPDSGVASPETTKNNSTETVDNIDSPITSKDMGSQSSPSSEINLDPLSPQSASQAPSLDYYERPASRISFVPEASNEVMSRGISVEGSSHLIKYGGNSSYETVIQSIKNTEEFFNTDIYDNLNQSIKKTEEFFDTGSYENLNQSIKKKEEFFDMNRTLDRLNLQQDMKLSIKKPTCTTTLLHADNSIKSVNSIESKPNLEWDSVRRVNLPLSHRSGPSSPRYQSDEGDCSVQSCLNQFTALELMTGNNKVGCEACTERINGKNGKTVYTNATKRFLVSSPPAVLILHLKRFQIGPRCMFRKMTKHVDFQTILDLAPFCATDKLKKLKTVVRGQSELLYSLYGVVEHSGGMHGGHYVAYVKLRGPARRTFLPRPAAPTAPTTPTTPTTDSDTSLSGYESGEAAAAAAAPPAAPPGRWYYVSDSMVQEATEEKVLRAQAYLLFYERIL